LVKVEAPYLIVIGVGDVQPIAVDGEAARLAEWGGDEGPDDAAAVDPAHPIVEGVRDVDLLSLRIPGDAVGRVELGRRSRTTLAGVAETAGSGDGADHRRLGTRGVIDRRDGDDRLAHLVSEGIRDVDVEARYLVADLCDLSDRHRIGSGKLPLRRVAAVARNRQAPGAGKGDLTVVDQQTNDMVRRIGDE